MLKRLLFAVFMVVALLACQKDEAELDEEEAIDDFLSEQLIDIEARESGLYYWEDDASAGTGDLPEKGDVIVFDIIGEMLTEGSSGNYEEFLNSTGKEAYRYEVGKTETIEGLKEGLKLVQEGTVAWMIIPSKLAYGDKQVGMVPATTPLLMYITVNEIIRK